MDMYTDKSCLTALSFIFYLLQIFPEIPEFSFFKIAQITFIGIGFPFEGNSHIGLISIFQPEKPIIIFNNIENIKKYDQHLHLLPQMDFFVIDKCIIFLIFGFPNEDKGKKSNAVNF